MSNRYVFPSVMNVDKQWSLSPPPGEFPQRRIWVFSLTQRHYMASSASPKKANLPLMLPALSMCPFSARPCARSRLRETLAFELLPRHFLLLENRERTREYWQTHSSICQGNMSIRLKHPSLHPSVGLDECTVIPILCSWSQSGNESDFVSKALFYSSTGIRTVLQTKSPAASSPL